MSTSAERLARYKARLGADWRECIRRSFKERTLWQGDGTWSTETPYFRNVRDAHTINRRMNHTGWYGDTTHQELLHIGVIGGLSHGRFVAGYRYDDAGTHVWFDEVWSDEKDAARCADEHARIAAEKEDEYQQKFHEAVRLDDLIEAKCTDVMVCKADLELAIAACHGLPGNARKYALGKRIEARALAREIASDIRALRAERTALNVES